MRPLKLSQITLIAAFLLAITAPLFLFNNEAEFSSREKRPLASPPEWRWDRHLLNEFPARFTAYFNDHYGLRPELIKRSQHLKKKYFNKSPTWLVIRGEQGWLFMDKRDSLKDHIGQIKLEENTLARWQQRLADKQRWLKQLGIEYIFVPIPNKMTLYPNYLPSRIQAHSGDTMLDQFLAYLSKQAKFTAYTELEPVLSNYQIRHPDEALYFRTDTHWTSLGAFVAYQHIMQQIRIQIPELEPALRLSDLQREDEIVKGDLANIINKDKQLEEKSYILVAAKQCASDIYTAISITRPDQSPEPEEKPAAVYNGCSKKTRTTVIIHDSFGDALRPFFSESFKRVLFITDYELSDMESLLNNEQPDVYLDLRVERNMKSLLNSGRFLPLDQN